MTTPELTDPQRHESGVAEGIVVVKAHESETHSWQGVRVFKRCGGGQNCLVASYSINQVGIEHATELIAKRQYVLRSEWGDVQPRAAAENAYLERHGWEKYAQWFLGLTDGAGEQTKARYAFVIGDFRRMHRSGIIACHYRAAEWRHKAIELAAHELLQRLDQTASR